ncbi:MAG: copper-binding protein [Caulobacteraceae bacterium]|nr:copper-binding protein [Caulobacteraceae bacterium]
MRKPIVFLVMIFLMAGASAHAQMGGGRGPGPGGGPGGPPPDGAGLPPPPAPVKAKIPTNQVQIVGVIKAIGPEPDRVTIAYEPVEALNWPAGTMPFVVEKTDLLKGASVGEKVSFRLDSQQISDLQPYAPPQHHALFGPPGGEP